MITQRIPLWSAALAGAFLLFTSATAVFAASPSLSLSGGGAPYSTVGIAGTGFGASEPVNLMLGLSNTSVTTDGTGSFSGASLTVPNVPSGTYIVIGVGQNTGLVAFSYLYVGSFFPNASPNAWYITPGSTLSWSGSGFAPNETITVSQGATTLASFAANSGGSFSAAGGTMVPYSLHGQAVGYSVRGAQSAATVNFTLAIADLYPYASPSSWYLLPGSALTFSGAGFGPNENLSLQLGTDPTVLASFAADSNGAFTAQGNITLSYGSGTADYKIVGQSSGAIAPVPVTRAAFYPSLIPSVWYSAPGSSITLGGTGFAPDEDVTIMSGSSAAGTAHTDSVGAFSGFALTVPTTPNTTAQISGSGSKSGANPSIGMAIGGYYTWMNLSAWWAHGGSPLAIPGHNFAAGETVSATAGSEALGSGTANGMGDVTISTHVPHGPAGSVTINLLGATSGTPASVNITIAPVWTDFQLGSYAGAPGADIQFTGHGYQFDEPVTITTDRTGSTVVATFIANGSGSFSGSWTVPADFTEGNLVVTATGTYSGDQKAITYYVTGL